jgi:hypothetical protein
MVVNQYGNTLLWPGSYDNLILDILFFSPVLGAAAAPTLYNAVIKRTGNQVTMGLTSIPSFDPSPRFGFSLSDIFKHQSYVRLDVLALGFINVNAVTWLTSQLTSLKEYFSNSKLNQAYVRHGKLLGWSSDGPTFTFRVYNKSGSSDFASSPGGTITVFNEDGASEAYTITDVAENWEITATGTAIPDTIDPGADPPFTLY